MSAAVQSRARYRRLLALAALLLFLLVAVPVARVGWIVFSIQQHLNALSGSDSAHTDLSLHARGLVDDYHTLRQLLGTLPDQAPRLAALPFIGAELNALPQFLAVADRAAAAAVPTLALYDALQQEMAQGQSPGQALLSVTRAHPDLLTSAARDIENARAAERAINSRTFSPQGYALLAKIDDGLTAWASALTLLERAPALVGADRPRYYLVLAQNSDELRPTGGFISAAGVIKIANGDISIENFGDSFAIDDLDLQHPLPPAPLQKYMWASQWLLRDANWYADFPTSAGIAQSMYAHDRHLQTDGVIAVDSRFLPLLVGAMPGVELDGAPLTGENVLTELKSSWKPLPAGDMSAAWFTTDRKNFLSELMGVLMTRVKAGAVEPSALGRAAWTGLRDKSLQIYLNDPASEQALQAAGWGGAVKPAAGDYLFVVDSNLGFNKVNARVTRAMNYTVRLDNTHADASLADASLADASLALTYQNPSQSTGDQCDLLKQHKDNTYASMEQSCYWNYLRVLAPLGSRLVTTQGVSDAGTAKDVPTLAAFGGYLILDRNTTATVRYNYTLPSTVWQNGIYTLTLQKQAGIAPIPTHIRVELPQGITAAATSLPIASRAANIIEFDLTLDRDTTLTLQTQSASPAFPLSPILIGAAVLLFGGALLLLISQFKVSERSDSQNRSFQKL